MSQIMRHVGKIKNTGTRCVVVFRKIPGNDTMPEDRDFALVVESDSLTEMYQDNLRSVVESPEAQQTVDLASVLTRRVFGDGANMLATLHSKGLLRKVSVDMVVLYPMPGQALPLRDANNAIDGIDRYQPQPKEVISTPVNSTNEEKFSAARNLLAQATLLKEDAKRKEEEAYSLDPTLRPHLGRVELTQEEKQRRKIESNVKRRKGSIKGSVPTQ